MCARSRSKASKATSDETLLKYDTATRTQIYRITADPDDMVPFSDYTATIKVKPITSRRSQVEWTSRFVPKKGKTKAECLEFVEGIYRTGIAGTREVLGVKK